jgi:hypothetical protein
MVLLKLQFVIIKKCTVEKTCFSNLVYTKLGYKTTFYSDKYHLKTSWPIGLAGFLPENKIGHDRNRYHYFEIKKRHLPEVPFLILTVPLIHLRLHSYRVLQPAVSFPGYCFRRPNDNRRHNVRLQAFRLEFLLPAL